LFPVYLLNKLYRKFSKWILMGALTALVLAFIRIAGTNDRLSYTLEEISSKGTLVKVLEKDVRYSIWSSATGVIKNNLLAGVGTRCFC